MGATLAIRDIDITDADAPTEDRVHGAALACIARFGLTKTTLEDIARESGVSRATIYRAFPGGRDVLLQRVLVREVAWFFDGLAVVLDAHDDVEELVVAALSASMRFLQEHEALGAVVRFEPGLLLSHFAFHRLDGVLDHVAAFAAPYLEPHVGSVAEARSMAEHLVRIVLSYTMHPSARVDPFDDASIRRLVRVHVLPGLAGMHPSTTEPPSTKEPQ